MTAEFVYGFKARRTAETLCVLLNEMGGHCHAPTATFLMYLVERGFFLEHCFSITGDTIINARGGPLLVNTSAAISGGERGMFAGFISRLDKDIHIHSLKQGEEWWEEMSTAIANATKEVASEWKGRSWGELTTFLRSLPEWNGSKRYWGELISRRTLLAENGLSESTIEEWVSESGYHESVLNIGFMERPESGA